MTFNPLICQTCTNQNIATIYPLYVEMVKNGVPIPEIFDTLKVEIQCCKTALLAHEDYMRQLEC